MLKQAVYGFCAVLLVVDTGYAQLNQVFGNVFNRILKDDLVLSTGEHAQHYFPAAAEAESRLTPALNTLITSNVASFPLTSTIAGVTWDISSGAPVSIKGSLGPIFAETAETLGKGRLNLGFNYSYLNLAKFRGVATEALRFAFTHQDNNDVLGDAITETDVIDLVLGMDANANLFAAFATAGITSNLDVGIAAPFIDLRIEGQARASLYGQTAGVDHKFKGGDLLNPQLSDVVSYQERATGLGDLAFRLKYHLLRNEKFNCAVLGDLRLPTGDEKEFLGSSKPTTRIAAIFSKKAGELTSHLNLAYEKRPANDDSDEFEFAVGFDQKVGDAVTFAVDLLGELDVNESEAIQFFPEPTKVITESLGGGFTRRREIELTNIPARTNDNTYNLAVGLRIAPSERFLLLGNLLAPLNDGGLRSSVVPTFGLTASF